MIQEEIGDTAVEVISVFFNNALIPTIVTLFAIMIAVYYMAGKVKFKQFSIELACIMMPVLAGLYTALFYFSPELREIVDFRLMSFWQSEGAAMASMTAPVIGIALLILLGVIIIVLSLGPTNVKRLWSRMRPLTKITLVVVVVAIVVLFAMLLVG